MQIAELKPGMQKVDISASVVSVSEEREVNTKFGPGQVATAELRDESGSIEVTLWNENISKVEAGKSISIQNGYVDSYQGKLRLNVGRYGKIASA